MCAREGVCVWGGQPTAKSHLEHIGHDGAVAAGPGLLHQIRIGLCNLTLHAQRVAEVELIQVAVFEEVLGELGHIAEALQGQGQGQGSEVEKRRER